MNNTEDFGPRFHPAIRGLRIVGLVLLGVIAAAAFALVFGYFVELLWNWLMPPIFGLRTIGYWQAFGLVVLAKLIFGAVHGRGAPARSWRKHVPAARAHDWGGRERWRYWREFWEQEGRQAFDAYLERRRKEASREPGQETL
jgi:hypothetical protein